MSDADLTSADDLGRSLKTEYESKPKWGANPVRIAPHIEEPTSMAIGRRPMTNSSKLDNSKVKEWLSWTGGYGILAPEIFIDMGMESDLVKRMTSTFSDDPDLGKGRVTRNDGKPGSVEGVAEFKAVDVVARIVGVEPCHSYYGRGTNFHKTRSRILKAIE